MNHENMTDREIAAKSWLSNKDPLEVSQHISGGIQETATQESRRYAGEMGSDLQIRLHDIKREICKKTVSNKGLPDLLVWEYEFLRRIKNQEFSVLDVEFP